MTKLYQLLPWDDEQLGIRCAKLIPEDLTADQMGQAFSELKTQGIQLVYWCANATLENQTIATKNNGLLTDEKLTYLQSLAHFHGTMPADLAYYPIIEPDQSLLQLAYDVCDQSRFAHDPKLTTAQSHKLYGAWLKNSCLHHNAMDVLVIPDDLGFAAMVTLGNKNGRGDIGLLAVAERARGKGLGKILVNGALAYFKAKGFTVSQVVTQKTNPAACKLYENCGYQIEKIEYFYHFWL